MQSNSGGVSHTQNSFKDVETLKREELHRRRLLRLEQVRQQSKDAANLVRQKVQGEREKQHGLVQERLNARTQQWQVRKIKELHREYESTVKNVGKGHHDAALLPNEEAIRQTESEKILAAAQRRGEEALKRLKEEETARRKADEERRLQLQNVRAIEEARSAAVVALPHPESSVGLKSVPLKQLVFIAPPPTKGLGKSIISQANKGAMPPEWPKKTWPQQSLPLGIIPPDYELEQGDHVRGEVENKYNTHGIKVSHVSVPFTSLDSRSKSMKSTNVVQKKQSYPSGKLPRYRDKKGSVTNSDVELYDYTSCYQSQYDKVSGVVKKVQVSGEINAKEAADEEISAEMSRNKISDAALREQQRSRDALRKVQVQRDYRNLLGSLSQLARQNSAFIGHGNVPKQLMMKNQTKEHQLKLAVENLLQDVEASIPDNLADTCSIGTPDGSLVVSVLEDSPGSVPRLNVGRWHPPRNIEKSSPKANSSPTESIIIAQPPQMCLPPLLNTAAREENFERDAALRSLVQRINEERHSLLVSSQQPAHLLQESQLHDVNHNKEEDIQQLEEKVLKQRHELKSQLSEVKRLGASIAVPTCISQSQEETSPCSSFTHESIIIEPSNSDKSGDPSSSPSVLSQHKTARKKGKDCKMWKPHTKNKSFINSPLKDGVLYSMDVSLSSVIVDQTETSSSGSKSLSVHGVQVLVKVCGTEEDTSERSSFISEEGGGVKVIEILSDSNESDDKREVRKKLPQNVLGKIIVDKDQRQKGKGSSDILEARPPKPVQEKIIEVSHKDKKIHKRQHTDVRAQAPKTHQLRREVRDKSDKNSDNSLKIDAKVKLKKRRGDKVKKDQPASTSTSYLSPPDQVLSSLTKDIKNLIALAKHNAQPQTSTKTDQHHNLPLVKYINKLLAMSKESIDRLNVSCSEVSTPPSTIFQSFITDNEDDSNLTDIGFIKPSQDQVEISSNQSQDQVDQSIVPVKTIYKDCLRQVQSPKAKADHWLLQSGFSDQEGLSNMTKQCHEKISALTEMIEEVRRQTLVTSPPQNDSDHSSVSHNQTRSSLPLDSTAYMSPPPQVLEWADIAFPSLSKEERESRVSLDPYYAAVMQLLADVRSGMTSQVEAPDSPVQRTPIPSLSENVSEPVESVQVHHKPPVAFWRNIERCNVSSPIEPHELSTIPELGTTLPESLGSGTAPISPVLALSSSSPGSPPDIIAELMRRQILTSPFAWAKKKEKLSHSSDSNVSLKNSHNSDLSSGKSGQSDISASKETNTTSVQSGNSSSNGLKDWETKTLMPPVDLYSSADEVEGDFQRMGIGWVGAMLRKTKEAGALSSTSSSEGAPVKVDNLDFKSISEVSDEEPILSSSLTVAMRRERSHSTPIKKNSDLSSSSGSHLV